MCALLKSAVLPSDMSASDAGAAAEEGELRKRSRILALVMLDCKSMGEQGDRVMLSLHTPPKPLGSCPLLCQVVFMHVFILVLHYSSCFLS